MLLERLQPAFEIVLLFSVFEKPDTFHDFPDGYDTEKRVLLQRVRLTLMTNTAFRDCLRELIQSRSELRGTRGCPDYKSLRRPGFGGNRWPKLPSRISIPR